MNNLVTDKGKRFFVFVAKVICHGINSINYYYTKMQVFAMMSLMENDEKKPMTVGELVAKMHPPVLSEGQISQFQEIGKRHAEMIENVTERSLNPLLNK
jgi:hypothetical protein